MPLFLSQKMEQNEPETLHLPRLVLNFDRHKHGRLRQLIDAINTSPLETEPREETKRQQDRYR